MGDDEEGHRASCLSRRKDPQRRTCVAEETTEATHVHAVHEEGTSRCTPQAKPSFFLGERSAARNGVVASPSLVSSNQHVDGSHARADDVVSLSSLCTVVFESTSRPSARFVHKATSCFARVHVDEAAAKDLDSFFSRGMDVRRSIHM